MAIICIDYSRDCSLSDDDEDDNDDFVDDLITVLKIT